MARRRRARLRAPEQEYSDSEHGVLVLRGSLSPGTRRKYEQLSHGPREDAWQRQVEFLWERLAVSWEVRGVPTESQRELLQRLRVATQEERNWVRQILRRHCEENFPDLEAP